MKKEFDQLEKSNQVYPGEEEGQKISAMRNIVVHDAENFALNLFIKPILVKNQLWTSYLKSANGYMK